MIPKFILNIKNDFIKLACTLILTLFELFFLIGFFAFPFIKYKSDEMQLAFSILWIVGAFVFLFFSIHTSKNNFHEKSHISIKLQQLLYIIKLILIVLGFGLSLLSKQYKIGGTISDGWFIVLLFFIFTYLSLILFLLYKAALPKKKNLLNLHF